MSQTITVEFAVIAPLVFLLIFATIEFGRGMMIVHTMEEAVRCRRRGIRVTTFMLTADPTLKRFVENFTEACRGRAYFADSARIESFVLVDFMRNRRRRVR